MARAICEITGISPYSQSAPIESERGANELANEFEEKTWRERMHFTPDEPDAKDGFVYIPAMAFKNALTSAAKYLSMAVKGKRGATYSKHFASGVIVADNAQLSVKASQVPCEKLFVPSDGVRGGGKRVWKYFPYIKNPWKATVEVIVIDDTITEEVFRQHLVAAGSLIGVGRFRPQNNGFYGRFDVECIAWEK